MWARCTGRAVLLHRQGLGVRALASRCRLPAAWADAEAEVFPTAGDVAGFVRSGAKCISCISCVCPHAATPARPARRSAAVTSVLDGELSQSVP